MSYVLIIMLFAHNAIAVTSVPMQNAELCDAARREALIAHDDAASDYWGARRTAKAIGVKAAERPHG